MPLAPASAQDYLNCHFVPGWEQSGAKRQYTADNLFDYRDGAAEGYLIFSFARMQGIDCQSGSTTLAIDVSDMTDADSAYGMFASNRDPNQPIAKIGMGGQLLAQSLLFAKGKYFVEIIQTDGSPTGDQTATLQAFAAKMAQLLEGRDTPPEALKWFPPENQESIRMVPESVLGLTHPEARLCRQIQRRPGLHCPRRSPESAADVMNKLRARYPDPRPRRLADEAFQAKAPYLNGICIFRKGRYIAGYTNLSDSAVAASKRDPCWRRISVATGLVRLDLKAKASSS